MSTEELFQSPVYGAQSTRVLFLHGTLALLTAVQLARAGRSQEASERIAVYDTLVPDVAENEDLRSHFAQVYSVLCSTSSTAATRRQAVNIFNAILTHIVSKRSTFIEFQREITPFRSERPAPRAYVDQTRANDGNGPVSDKRKERMHNAAAQEKASRNYTYHLSTTHADGSCGVSSVYNALHRLRAYPRNDAEERAELLRMRQRAVHHMIDHWDEYKDNIDVMFSQDEGSHFRAALNRNLIGYARRRHARYFDTRPNAVDRREHTRRFLAIVQRHRVHETQIQRICWDEMTIGHRWLCIDQGLRALAESHGVGLCVFNFTGVSNVLPVVHPPDRAQGMHLMWVLVSLRNSHFESVYRKRIGPRGKREYMFTYNEMRGFVDGRTEWSASLLSASRPESLDDAEEEEEEMAYNVARVPSLILNYEDVDMAPPAEDDAETVPFSPTPPTTPTPRSRTKRKASANMKRLPLRTHTTPGAHWSIAHEIGTEVGEEAYAASQDDDMVAQLLAMPSPPSNTNAATLRRTNRFIEAEDEPTDAAGFVAQGVRWSEKYFQSEEARRLFGNASTTHADQVGYYGRYAGPTAMCKRLATEEMLLRNDKLEFAKARGDGNCGYHSFMMCISGTRTQCAKEIVMDMRRRIVVNYIREWDRYHVGSEMQTHTLFVKHLCELSKDATYADAADLHVLARQYRCRFLLLQTDPIRRGEIFQPIVFGTQDGYTVDGPCFIFALHNNHFEPLCVQDSVEDLPCFLFEQRVCEQIVREWRTQLQPDASRATVLIHTVYMRYRGGNKANAGQTTHKRQKKTSSHFTFAQASFYDSESD